MAIEALGYVIVETTSMEDWQIFLGDVVGASRVDTGEAKSRHYRIDDRPFRFRIVEGTADRLLAAAYHVDTQASLDVLADRLAHAGHPVRRGDAQEAAVRGVDAFFSVSDPAGNGLEFYCGESAAPVEFVSPIGVKRFITGELGMGHAVFAAPEFDVSHSFYRDLLGFHDTDLPSYKLSPNPEDPGVRFAFMHADNGRHHSVAIGEMPPSPAGCVHLMLELPEREDVEACHARMLAANVPESASLGRHSNDQMTSFYMRTPSGFDMEVGCEGLVLDPATWETTALPSPSEWGHEWSWQKALAASSNDESQNPLIVGTGLAMPDGTPLT